MDSGFAFDIESPRLRASCKRSKPVRQADQHNCSGASPPEYASTFVDSHESVLAQGARLHHSAHKTDRMLPSVAA